MLNSAFIRGIVRGMVGGLAGTYIMYLFGACIFTLLGWPANTSFKIIGNSAAAFFSMLGITLTGGSWLGMRLYFMIGLIMGAILGVAVVSLRPLHQAPPKKKVGLSILYVEVLSLPLLAAGTMALKMSATNTVLWFGISLIMHLVYGLVLGLVMSYGVGRTVLNTTPSTTLGR